jgi:ATP-dependent Lhr-like helicase
VWDQGWTALRPIQERAADPILRGDADVIISAPTAGGKTEAAFLPIVSRLAEGDLQSVGCVCVSPLKALINDQTDRLGPLLERVHLPLTPWHGDVAQTRKQKLLRERRGVLLITPESLEAIFVLRGSQVPQLFQDLRYIVVDELHSFIGRERGRQLQSLLNRVELAVRKRIPRIALSATLGDMGLAAEALRPGCGPDVVLIEGERDGRELRMQLRGYRERPPELQEMAHPEPTGAAENLPGDLFDALRGTDNLIFANSRQRVEELTDRLRRLSDLQRVPNEFLAHHGNLSREIREEAEQRLKDRSRPTSVICTSTLELGIDIGSVTSIAQVGAPPSVASLRQRLGRSGRRGEPAVLRIFLVEEELHETSNLMDELRAQLIQSIAMVQLLLARWCEPPTAGQLHFSTLVQQILSVIAQHGGASARDLYRALCQTGPFRGIDSDLFGRLLRCLGEGHILTQTSDGALALGERGEKVVDHYSFYVSFVTPEEYRLVAGSTTLGTMPITQPLAPGGHLIFAGRRWQVLRVDDTARLIELTPAKGGRPPRFEGGGFDVRDRVRDEMLRIYSSSSVPVYLDGTAKELLSEGRSAFSRLNLSQDWVLDRGGIIYLFPWRGDRVLHTLMLQLAAHKLAAGTEGIAVAVRGATLDQVATALAQIGKGTAPSGPLLARLAHNQLEEKYDWTLSPDLRCIDYASRHFDEAGAREAASRILDSLPNARTEAEPIS